MRNIADQFKQRTEHYKEIVQRPLTPSADILEALEEEVEEKRKQKILLLEDFTENAKLKGPCCLYKGYI